ncbi:hypothetical protein I4P28_23170 [Enterobacter kobei]|uniref:hypothetical protein n=1 Tax=Enterobacter kobei TaxID=208224 RepID=UPI0018C30B07|nr:hypothetical protein [Enterobacter kobei]MBG0645222.1 hypothetical protein [Enterobacter kobei]
MEKMGELLEKLVSDLPGLGGWPKWADECILHRGSCKAMFYDGAGRFQGYPSFPDIKFKEEALKERIVYREMYESALAASKTEWDGKGLPPVGCECEALYDTEIYQWFAAKIIAHDGGRVVGRWIGGDSGGELFDYPKEVSFRPIRSEADKKKEAAIFAIAELCRSSASNGHSAELIYDAIKSGKIVID